MAADGKGAGARIDLEQLVSEGRNPASMNIDLMSTADLLQLMNAEDRHVPEAVARELPQIARAVDAVVDAFNRGGRLVYIGAGTSGRLGVLDASECPPTFGVPPGKVVGIIAGGAHALLNAVEGAEDDAGQGTADLRAIELSARDVVVGIAVSGRTPYVIGALEYAETLGVTTVGLTCNPNSPVARMARISIAPLVGPEVLTGSTRLKSGTAQKLVLNMLSTASMIRTGRAYQNLMVDMVVSNEKLAARAIRIVMQATDCSSDTAREALAAADNDMKLAILMILTGDSIGEARTRLARAKGFLRRAVEGDSK